MPSKQEQFRAYVGEPMRQMWRAVPSASRSLRLNAVCERYMAIVADELSDLNLSRDEWGAISDATIDTTFKPLEQSTAMLCAAVLNAPAIDEKWGVNQQELSRNLAALPTSTAIAIAEACDRVRSRWLNMPIDKALLLSGVTPR